MGKPTWTVEQEQFLRDNWPFKNMKEISDSMKLKPSIIKSKASRMKLLKDRSYDKGATHRKWTSELDQKLTELYPDHTCKQIAEIMGFTHYAVEGRRSTLGLTKDENIGRIKKGNIPPNKGKKMSPEVREKVKHTFFKKGHTPVNTSFDGKISIRKNRNRSDNSNYKYIRLSKGEWELLHRYNWEKEFGPIPEGMNVVFKTSDKMNCETENLEMISDAELMQRNTIHQYPEELAEVIKLKNKIKKQIDVREKKRHIIASS